MPGDWRFAVVVKRVMGIALRKSRLLPLLPKKTAASLAQPCRCIAPRSRGPGQAQEGICSDGQH
jgi:hypothetical protein